MAEFHRFTAWETVIGIHNRPLAIVSIKVWMAMGFETWIFPQFPLNRRLDSTKESWQIPYMTQSTLTSKNQTTIPKAVIEALNLRPSDQLVYEIEADGRIILSAKTGTFASVAASLPRKAPKGSARTVDEMKFAVKSMAVKRMSRSRS